LLRGALALEPSRVGVTFDLAHLLGKTGQHAEAQGLYQDLARRCRGAALRRARRRVFMLAPTPAAAWRWLRAVVNPYTALSHPWTRVSTRGDSTWKW
jgi:hypothetical protein